MLFFDQLKKNDPQLRLLALVVLGGLGLLLAGLWWVQVVSARDYKAKLETQSFRTVRVPAVRGKILDRNGTSLADSRPSFNVALYLEELRKSFESACATAGAQLRGNLQAQIVDQERALNRKLTRKERARLAPSTEQKNAVRQHARFLVASNAVAGLASRLQQQASLDEAKFQRHYTEALVLPLPVLANLEPGQVARFEEGAISQEGLDLEMQPVRVYPYGSTAAHLLGQLRRDINSAEGEDSFLNYPLPVFRGTVGIEATFDSQLRGRAGSKSVLVNNLGYRQSESIWSPARPGDNVVLTLDLPIQLAAEKALQRAGAETRGAVVVLNTQNGDLLAMASSPSYDPNLFVRGISAADWQKLSDEKLRPQINRAAQDNYAPGSIFKIVTALACLENGLDPAQKIYNPGFIYVGRSRLPKRDLAPPGEYDFHRALLKSSNTYFISNGLKAGIQNILRIAQRLHLGERTDLPTRQEVAGSLPDLKRVSANWRDGDTANICIGQGELAVTPLQMAVMTAAIANGGRVFWPRLVNRIEPQEAADDQPAQAFPPGRVRDHLAVQPRHLQLLRDAMVADTEDPEGTGYDAFHRGKPGPPILQSLRVCGKTGTAQVMNERNQVTDHTAWFVSFAPYEKPHYAVVVMVESAGSGAGAAAPIAREIYLAIEKQEAKTQRSPAAVRGQ